MRLKCGLKESRYSVNKVTITYNFISLKELNYNNK